MDSKEGPPEGPSLCNLIPSASFVSRTETCSLPIDRAIDVELRFLLRKVCCRMFIVYSKIVTARKNDIVTS